jgi:hypothetical protein
MELLKEQQAAKSVMGMFRSFARILGHKVEDSTTHKFQQHHELHQKLSHKENQKQEML